MATPSQQGGSASVPASIGRWVKTPCGRARYLELAARPGLTARLRLGWFVLVASLRDLPLAPPPPERGGPPG